MPSYSNQQPYQGGTIAISFIFVLLLLMTSACECCMSLFGSSNEKTRPTGSLPTPPPPPAVASECGHNQYYHYTGKGIIGGMDIQRNQYPWFARLKIGSGSSSFLCGSTIINDNYLLTAAHCVNGKTASNIVGIFSDYDRTKVDKGEYTRAITNVTIHEKFDSKTQENDFALLKLKEPITFTDWKTQKICLPTSCSDGCETNAWAYIAGFGVLTDSSKYAAKVMQTGLVKIIDQDKCKATYAKHASHVIADTMICAGIPDAGGVDTCLGDSGGPLMVVQDGFYKLCGVTSFGQGCGKAKFPGVYARVCTAIDWINSITNSL